MAGFESNIKIMTRKFNATLTSLIVVLLLSTSVQAIVIRHDTGYARHSAREAQFPAVFYLEQRGQRRICVATLIHPQWAITAAHCAQETSLASVLAAGEVYGVRIGGERRFIDQIHIHPDYPEPHGESGQEVDLALLRLQEPADMPQPLPLYRDQDEQNRIVTLMGWGFFGIGTQGIQVDDGQFRIARNTIQTANHRLRFTFDDPRHPNSQAIDLEGLPGLGDSGGPALLATAHGWQIAGIAVGELQVDGDSARRQGMYGAIAVYERVSLHIPWIEQIINGNLLFTQASGLTR
jgi:secreted trypsin-like serine protease